MKKHLNINNEGFTLVELMLALTVFAFGILALGQLQLTSIRYNSHAQQMSEATMLAQSKMEELMSMDYANAVSSTASEIEGIYSTDWDVTDDAPVVGAKGITVTVGWSSRGGDKEVVLDSIRTELGEL